MGPTPEGCTPGTLGLVKQASAVDNAPLWSECTIPADPNGGLLDQLKRLRYEL